MTQVDTGADYYWTGALTGVWVSVLLEQSEGHFEGYVFLARCQIMFTLMCGCMLVSIGNKYDRTVLNSRVLFLYAWLTWHAPLPLNQMQ